MSVIMAMPVIQCTIPTDIGIPKGKYPAFREESPPAPVTFLHAWVKWENVLGGGATSIGVLRAYMYGSYLGSTTPVELFVSKVDDQQGHVYRPFYLFSAAAPANNSVLLRIGNFSCNDGRFVKIYGEMLEFTIENSGTAYTQGLVTLASLGWIE